MAFLKHDDHFAKLATSGTSGVSDTTGPSDKTTISDGSDKLLNVSEYKNDGSNMAKPGLFLPEPLITSESRSTPDVSLSVSPDRSSISKSGSGLARKRRLSLPENRTTTATKTSESENRPVVSALATQTYSLNTATNSEAKLDKKPAADKEKLN